MTKELIKFEFRQKPKEILYIDNKPLNLTNQLSFYHNKNRFRKELTRLQNLFKDKINDPLLASGIRDTYLKEEYTENYLILIFTSKEKIKESNEIVELLLDMQIEKGCALIKTTEDYMVLISKEMTGLTLGIDYIEEILTQILDEYIKRKEFDEYIKVRQFKLIVCSN